MGLNTSSVSDHNPREGYRNVRRPRRRSKKRGFLEHPRCGPDFREPAPATLGALPSLNPQPGLGSPQPRPPFDPGPAGPWLRASTPPRLGPRPGLTSALTSPLARPGLTSAPVSALTSPAQPRAGPPLGPRPRLGPSPASPSAAAAQMLLGGRRWFRSRKMAALTAATSVPAAAGDAGERGSPPRSPTHSPFAVRRRRLRAGGRDRTLGRRAARGGRLAPRCACARPPRPRRA
ncbi:translation initiation factor IF-2-like [Budorcas taxicolor]|uniref:translation initiation factor IF-2-like n=1 Tax=Budorcas taxicolor TaxID=37181 RepID=UPI002283CEB8|nr:translation initiation factor IF-2-like [Budorcas taxicolor]